MNKKLLAIGAAAVGLVCEVAIHGYMDVMAKEKKIKSVIGYFGTKASDKSMEDMTAFTQKKLEWINKQDTENISITSRRGDTLKGYLTLNKNESKVFVFFAHGYRADHNGDPANFMQYYIEKGYNFLSVDHVAQGESSGNYLGFDYFESVDSLDWLDYLISRFGEDIKIIIHGVSMGGATVCKMVESVPNQVRLAIADCPYTSALEEFDNTAKGVGVKHTKGLLKIFNAMNKVFAGFDLNDTDVRSSVKNSKVPMLFVHGTADTFVPTKMGVELYDICENDKELFLVENATHAQSIRFDEQGYHQRLDDFIEKYL
ncbi:MAG: alpha/beta hydrolase [Eubacterium sp.]|nr:alpha/beta hydrolase [Eubacterium sp.]